jgi:phenazine biosynthesis protein phzE
VNAAAWARRLLGEESFAVLYRPRATGPGHLEVLVADAVEEVAETSRTPRPPAGGGGAAAVLALLPYRQIGERGFDCPDDHAPLITLTAGERVVLPVAEFTAALPDADTTLRGGSFDLDDAAYEDVVRSILTEEIGRGTGANFVAKRCFSARFDGWSTRTALACLGRLLGRDPDAYWTFLVVVRGRAFIGASPERHVSLEAGTVVMNPISGTYRYPPGGPALAGLLDFLSDGKEANELYMVLDEELKMMAGICDLGGTVAGPNLKELATLAHTEYHITGRSTLDARDILRRTMFAPTVVGGPLESACRVVRRYEPQGRGYYAGAIALIGHDAAGDQSMDSAILIRTADVDVDGTLRMAVGATLVRDSDPASEAAETRAKAAGLVEALSSPAAGALRERPPRAGLAHHPAVQEALERRNLPLSPFWFHEPDERRLAGPAVDGRSILVIDAEDTFTAMARHVLEALGLTVTVRRFDEELPLDAFDLVVVGPGPGDPTDTADPKIAILHDVVRALLSAGTPFLAVCLGHQVLSTVLGLEITAKEHPSQGVQHPVRLRDHRELVGFYNTFVARCPSDRFPCPIAGGSVEVIREGEEVHALRGPAFASVQFHPASVLTQRGVHILADMLAGLTAPAALPAGRVA